MSRSPTYVFLSIFALYHLNLRYNVLKYHSKYIFNAHYWNLFLIKKFHGTISRVPWNFFNNIWTAPVVPWNSMELTQQSLKFHGIPWDFAQIQSSHEFHWTCFMLPSSLGIPWKSMDFLGTSDYPAKSSMEMTTLIFVKSIFLNVVVGIWLMIICLLAISQKRYILHWFEYRNSYFEHPSVSENSTRSTKMASCIYIYIYIYAM